MVCDSWDPFSDPADVDGSDLPSVAVKGSSGHFGTVHETNETPLDPWEDHTYVTLAQEAAKEAEEAKKMWQQKQEVEKEEDEVKEIWRMKVEKEAREIAKLSMQESLKGTSAGGFFWFLGY